MVNVHYKLYVLSIKVISLVVLIFAFCSLSANNESTNLSIIKTTNYDLVVIGASPSGFSCAVRAAREGLKVLLVERTKHVGGFLSSGCGGWEAPYDGFRSPIYAEIRMLITKYYGEKYEEGSQQYLASIPTPTGNRHIDRAKVEPKVAELLFNQIINNEKNLTLLVGFYPVSVERDGTILESVEFKEFCGDKTIKIKSDIFSDCTYEGDLAALAGVPYRVGREARDEYNEPHAGIVYTKNCVDKGSNQRFSTEAVEGRIKIRTFPGSMCKEEVLPGSTGKADNAVMSYNYRLILTSDPENQVPIEKPDGYDPTQFEGFDGGSFVPDIPNQKIGYNYGRIVGPQVQYPEGNWETRDSISQIYLNYSLQELYYLKHDAPAEIREKWRVYSLAKDEFIDNNNIPYEIYVREARRIVGKYVFTEHDNIPIKIERTPIHFDAIAITDWPVDLVASVNRRVSESNLDGIVFLARSSRPAQVPYRCILPKGLKNLLVPLCLSATHVGWGSIRLEPVWMQIGEAAGFAAALSMKLRTTPADLNSELLLQKLVQNNFEITLFNDLDVTSGEPWNSAIQYFGTKGFFRGYDARPMNNLTQETAKIWIDLFNKLYTEKKYNATNEATKLPITEEFTSETSLSVSDFIRCLQKSKVLKKDSVDSALKKLPSPYIQEALISRGNACLLMYNLLKNH